MCPAVVSGIITGDVPVSYWLVIFSLSQKTLQHAKKVMSDGPGPVDFAIGLVNPVLSLPECLVEFCKVTLTFESVDEIL